MSFIQLRAKRCELYRAEFKVVPGLAGVCARLRAGAFFAPRRNAILPPLGVFFVRPSRAMTRDGHSAGNQLEQAPPPPPPPLRSHAPHENLQAALDRGNLPTDRLALALICLVYGGIIARGELLPHEHRVSVAWGVAGRHLWRRSLRSLPKKGSHCCLPPSALPNFTPQLLCGLVVAHAGLLALALAAPGRFLARRTALMAAVRFIDVGVLPLIVDWVRIHQPSRPARQAAEAAAAATAAAAAGSGWWAAARRWGVLAGARLQSAVLLVVGAAKLQSLVGAAVGAALPPALHLLLHTATIAAMCLNAPKGARAATPPCLACLC